MTLRLLSYNIKFGGRGRERAIAEVIRGATPDVVLLQEATDPRVIEQLIRLPAHQKFQPVGYKPILRRHGLEGLDPQLFDRPKSGFVLPFDRWIRRNLGHAMDQWMRDDRACAAAGLHGQAVARIWAMFQDNTPGIYWTRVWALYVLIRWCHRHGVLV